MPNQKSGIRPQVPQSHFGPRLGAAALVLTFTAGPALAAKPLAPVYPGAAYDALASAKAPHAKVYLSQDSLATVRAWYRKKLGKGENFNLQCETASRPDRMTRCTAFRVLKSNVIPPGGSMVDAYEAGVQLKGWQKASGSADDAGKADSDLSGPAQVQAMMAKLKAMGQQMKTVNQQETGQMSQEAGVDLSLLARIPDRPFSVLKQEVLMHRHSEKDLKSVYQHYKGLETAFYPMASSAQGPLPYEQKLYNQCRRMFPPPTPLDSSGSDHWNDWLHCLKRMAAHAYRTRIRIDLTH